MTDTGAFLQDWFGRLKQSGWTAEVFLDALSEDLVWTATGTSPISGTYHGRDAYIDGVYRPLDERLESWPRPTVERIIAQGDWGVVEFSSKGGRGKNGTDYNMRYCWLMHVEDGLVTEVIGYYDTSTVVALFT
jgi:ketosteroid isomerase-like protein